MSASLDPRVNRLALPSNSQEFTPLPQLDQWQTYEVFHQKSRGEQHQHVGAVHAPNGEMALLFAKEQYARRMKCVNLWVVKTTDVVATDYEDEDMFVPATDKSYREAYFYKNREAISEFKKAHTEPTLAPSRAEAGAPSHPPAKARIILGKKK